MAIIVFPATVPEAIFALGMMTPAWSPLVRVSPAIMPIRGLDVILGFRFMVSEVGDLRMGIVAEMFAAAVCDRRSG